MRTLARLASLIFVLALLESPLVYAGSNCRSKVIRAVFPQMADWPADQQFAIAPAVVGGDPSLRLPARVVHGEQYDLFALGASMTLASVKDDFTTTVDLPSPISAIALAKWRRTHPERHHDEILHLIAVAFGRTLRLYEFDGTTMSQVGKDRASDSLVYALSFSELELNIPETQDRLRHMVLSTGQFNKVLTYDVYANGLRINPRIPPVTFAGPVTNLVSNVYPQENETGPDGFRSLLWISAEEGAYLYRSTSQGLRKLNFLPTQFPAWAMNAFVHSAQDVKSPIDTISLMMAVSRGEHHFSMYTSRPGSTALRHSGDFETDGGITGIVNLGYRGLGVITKSGDFHEYAIIESPRTAQFRSTIRLKTP